MIAPNFHARRGKRKGGVWKNLEGSADYRGIVQPSQPHVAPCVKGVE